MAAGGELVIDDKFLQSLKRMDDVLQGITDSASDTDKSMQKWLSKLNDNSVLNFIEHLSKIASQYRLINETLKDVDGFKDFANKADEANTAIQSLIQNIRNTERFNLEIDVEEGLKDLKAISDHIDEMIQQEKKLAKEEADTHKQRQQEYDELGRSLKEYGDAMVHNFHLLTQQYEAEVKLARKEQEATERKMEAIRKFIEARREAEQTSMNASFLREWEEQQRQQEAAYEQYAKQVDARRKEREKGIEAAHALDKKEEEEERKRLEEQQKQEEKAESERYQTALARMHAETKEHKRAEEEKVRATREAIKKQNEAIAEANSRAQASQQVKQNAKQSRQAYEEQMRDYAKLFDEADVKEKEKLEKSLNDYRKYYSELHRLAEEYNQLIDTKAQGIDTGVNVDSVVERMKAIESLASELQAKMNEIASSSPEAKERSADIEKEIDASKRLAKTKKEVAEATKRQKEEEEAQRKRLGEATNGAIDFANALMEISKAQTKLKLQGKTSYDEAMGGYSFLFGGGGEKSLSNLREVQRALEEAKSKQDRFTESGKKRYEELNDALDKVKEKLDEVSDASDETNKSHSKLMDTSGQLMRQLALVFSVSQIEGYISKLVSVRKEFELQQRSLQVLLQNKQQANEIWNQTIQLAVKSPFRVKELVTYTKQLAAYRIESEKLHDTTKMLADVSAGLGVDMNRLILAFGQVRAAEFLRGTELRQFTEAGIPMLEELADHFSALEGRAVSTADVFERISKRMVVFADVEAVFKRLTGESGAFYKMQEKQSETLYGAISNLHDSIDIMLNDIGKSHDGLIKGSVAFARKMVDNWQTIATAIKAAAGGLVLYKLNALLTDKALVRMAVSMNVVTASGTKQLTVMQLLNVGFLRLGKSIGAVGKAMKVFFLSNPWTAIIMAMTAAVVELYSTWNDHKKQLDEINKEYDELIRKVSNIRVEFTFSNDLTKKRQKLQELIDVAEQLNISPNIKMDGITADNIDEIFDNLRKIVIDRQGLITALSTDFEKATHWTISDDLNEDLKEVGGNITKLVPIIEKYKSSVITYIDDLGQLSEERKKMFEPIRKDESELQYYDRLFKAFGEVSKAQKEASTSTTHWFDIMDKAPNVIKEVNNEITKWRTETNHFFDRNEAKKEFDAFVSTILPMLKNIPEEDRSIVIKTWIDTEASKREWDTFTTQYLYGWFEQIPSLNIKFKAELPSEKAIEPWKVRVTEAITKLNEKIQKEQKGWTKDMVLFSLPTDTDTEESFWNKFKEDITKAETPIIEGQKKLSQALVDNINVMKPYADEAKVIANITDKTTKSERDANTILNKRISLIKEIHSAYEKERKLWDEKTSEERVLQSYMVAYEDAFGKNISEYNFKIKEGVSSELLELIPLAEKAGKEAMIALERAIASVEVESGDLDKKLADEKLIRQVEDMFGTYELSLELKDMNIPTEIAEKLFGFESLDLEGLKEKLKELEPQFVGTDQEKKYRDYLQKVEKMEEKALKDRIKKFYKFLQDTTDAIKVAQQEGALDIQFAAELFNSGKLTAEQYNQSVRKIIADTNKEISKLNLDKFKDSPEYIAAMGDMAGYTAQELIKLQDTIKNLIAKSSSTMQPEEIKAYNDALNKINDQLDRLKSPFSKTAISEIKEINRLNKELDAEKAKQLELEKRRKELEIQESELTTKLRQQKYHGSPQQEIDETIAKIQETQEGIADINGELNTTAGNIANISNKLQKLYGGSSKGWATANKVLTETFRGIDGAVQLFNEVKDLAASFGADVDTGAWSDLSIIFSGISEMSQKFQSSWQSFASGDYAGAVAGLVGGIFSVIKLFNQLHDNKLEKQIKQQEYQVKLMGKAYEKLEKQMEGAYSTESIKQNTDEMLKNLEEQAAANEKMAELEQAKKDTDKEKVEQYLEERDKALEEREKLLIEKEKAFGGFGGQEDYKSVSEEFVDAWLSAFKETGSGLKGLQEKFDEFFLDMIRKQLLNNVMEKSMTAFYDDWDAALADDGGLDKQEAESLKQAWKTLQGELDSKLQAMTDVMGVTDDIRGTPELGTLTKGIQGVTEDTAEIIASYLNAMRFMLGEQSSNIKSITDNYGNIEAPNTMLGQLKMIADNTRAINDLLGSVTKAGHREGGYGIKVFTD